MNASPIIPCAEPAPMLIDELQGARTISEAAGLLRVSKSTISGWRRDGKIKVIRAGKRVLIPRSAIEAILKG